jgi:Zn-dependent protease
MLNLDPSTLISYLFLLLTSFPVHEFAHAWTANFFGDDTPRMNGRLTLNPLAHLDPIGSLLLLFAGFGWAKPVPVNPYVLQRRSPAALMWVSLAGPLSNFIMAIIAAIPFRLGIVSIFEAQTALFSRSHILPTIPQLLWVFIYINLLLMLFNLIPIAPLDGDKIAEYFFPPSWSRVLNVIRPYGPLILLAVVFLGPLGMIINPPLSFLMNLLVG